MNYEVGYYPKYFKIHELVPPNIYKRYKERAIMFLDSRIVYMADLLREELDVPCTINNYYWEGNYSNSGLRDFTSRIGSKYSQHKFGRALDLKFKNIKAETVRQHILTNQDKYKFITRMEKNVSWVHIDNANVKSEKGIILFSP